MSRGKETESQAVINIITKDKRQVVVPPAGTYNTWESRSCKGYAQLQGLIFSTGNGTLNIWQSTNEGVNWDLLDSYPVVAFTGLKVVCDIYGEKIVITYDDGGGGSTIRLGIYLIPIGSSLVTVSGIITIASMDIQKWGGVAQSGANLTPLFQKLPNLDETAGDYGTSTGLNGANTLNDTTKKWGSNIWIAAALPTPWYFPTLKYLVKIISGTGAGQIRVIASNTPNQLTITATWAIIPDATSVYAIQKRDRVYTNILATLFNLEGYSDMASGGSLTTIDTAWADWQPNTWKGHIVTTIDGTGAFQVRKILSNTATQLVVEFPFTIAPDATTLYAITPNVSDSNTISQLSGDHGVATGLAVGNTIDDTTKDWDVNIWSNADGIYAVKIISGTGVGQIRVIASNTANQLTINNPWTTQPDVDSVYAIQFITSNSKSTAPDIYNVTMTLADTEYSQALPTGCKKFSIMTRDGTSFRLAYVTGKVATPIAPYLEVPTNVIYDEDELNLASQTLYFACASAGKIIQITVWS